MIGSVQGTGRTMPLDASWTVKGDPELKRRADEAEAKKQARAAEEQAERDADEKSKSDFENKYGRLNISTVAPGDILEDHQGNRSIVREIADGEPYGHELGYEKHADYFAPGGIGGALRNTGERAGADYWRKELKSAERNLAYAEKEGYDDLGWQIGRRRVGKECLRLCRSRWSPYH